MSARDRAIVRDLARWFGTNARDLPWRRGEAPTASGRDPYHALVSEIMLQQTQVARVLERFGPFLARFPTLADLARADEREVLALWSGLGYYRRARLLHAAARACVAEHGGRLPEDEAALARLPGVGRYTAGAIASLVHHRAAPIVDGNVARVLVRVEGQDLAHGEAATTRWAWARAGALALAAGPAQIAPFNEGLMELGATVCTPRSPACGRCPLAPHCAAHAQGRADAIPRPKARAARRALFGASAVVLDEHGRALLVRRPARGLWAGLWAPPTVERDDRPPRVAELRRAVGLAGTTRVGALEHATTHRAVRLAVYLGHGLAGEPEGETRWVGAGDLEALGLSSAHRRVLEMGWARAGAVSSGACGSR